MNKGTTLFFATLIGLSAHFTAVAQAPQNGDKKDPRATTEQTINTAEKTAQVAKIFTGQKTDQKIDQTIQTVNNVKNTANALIGIFHKK